MAIAVNVHEKVLPGDAEFVPFARIRVARLLFMSRGRVRQETLPWPQIGLIIRAINHKNRGESIAACPE
jgi:hypothetical protein